MTSKTITAKSFVHAGGNADTSSGSGWQSKERTERVLIKTVKVGGAQETFGALNKKLRGEVFAEGNSTGKIKSSTD